MILVTGDVVLDFSLYVGSRMDPSSAAPGTVLQKAPGGAMLTYGILQAIGPQKPTPHQRNPSTLGSKDIAFGLHECTAEKLEAWPRRFHNFAIWEQDDPPRRLKDDKNKRWRLKQDLGFGADKEDKDANNKEKEDAERSASPLYPAVPAPGLNELKPRIVVIDDGSLGFRHSTANRKPHACWPELIEAGPQKATQVEWVVLKMASPLGGGDLCQTLKAKWKEKLIVLVAARDLRRENIVLAQGLSWEQTAEDLLRQLDNHEALRDLAKCRHMVITLRGDGALWLTDPGDPERRRAQLIFDPALGEGEWEQNGGGRHGAYGFLSIVAASLAWRLWQSIPAEPDSLDLLPALRAGLSASRVLWELGNGPVPKAFTQLKQVEPAGFPFVSLASELVKPIVTEKSPEAEPNRKESIISVDKLAYDYGSVGMPAEVIRSLREDVASAARQAKKAPWAILRTNTETAALTAGAEPDRPVPLFGPARRVALFGPAAMPDIPCAKFEGLLTMDRSDVETLRSIRRLMLAYRNNPTKQPLSLAVFGAPGSGKSFGLKQIAKGIFGERNPIFEFNLSQFASATELYGAYHQVRDSALAGFTPVVFWDEFDAEDYKWLQYLLAPMQDGAFQEGQLTHSIGRCVFVFAGGTSFDYEHFGLTEDQDNEDDVRAAARRQWAIRKGPDFKSRLSAYLNVLGPNPRLVYAPDAVLAKKWPWRDDPNDVGFPIRRAILLRGLLGAKTPDALLKIDRGLLTALLEVGHYRNGARSMEKLVALLRGPDGEPPSRARLPHRNQLELFVKEVDDFYKLLAPRNVLGSLFYDLAVAIHADYLKKIEGKAADNPESAKLWDHLSPELKHSNIAAAERIAETLSIVGCAIEPGLATDAQKGAVKKVLKDNLELLAAEEHNGWWDTKRADGWRFGPVRNNETREHPLMIPYNQLPEKEKDKDRTAITDYPKLLNEAGFKIVLRRPTLRAAALPSA